MSYSILWFLKECKCAYSWSSGSVIYIFESCIEKLSILVVCFCAWGWVTLHRFHCMTGQSGVGVVILRQCGLGVFCVFVLAWALEKTLVIRYWTQRKKVVFFFQVTQLLLSLVLNLPNCCFSLISNLAFHFCGKRLQEFADRKAFPLSYCKSPSWIRFHAHELPC